MKTTIKQTEVPFTPVEVSIRLDTIDELEQFLLMTSAMTDSDSYNHKFLRESLINLSDDYEKVIPAVPSELAEFVEDMVSVEQWRELRKIYINHTKEVK